MANGPTGDGGGGGALAIVVAIVVGIVAVLGSRLLTGETSTDELGQNLRGFAPSGPAGGSESGSLFVESDPNPDRQTESAGEGTTPPGQDPEPTTDRNPDRATTGASPDVAQTVRIPGTDEDVVATVGGSIQPATESGRAVVEVGDSVFVGPEDTNTPATFTQSGF